VAADHIAQTTTTINAPADAVWRALVSPDANREFMFGANVESDWQPGRPITWRGEWEGKPYEDKGEILRAEENRCLSYTHFSPLTGQPDVPENYHTVTIELEGHGDETRVSLSQDNNASEEERQHSEENWAVMLRGLKQYVER